MNTEEIREHTVILSARGKKHCYHLGILTCRVLQMFLFDVSSPCNTDGFLQHTRLLRHMQSPWHPAVHAASLASADCSTQRPATPKSQKLPPAPLPPVVLKPVTPGRYLSMRAFPWCAREHFLPIS